MPQTNDAGNRNKDLPADDDAPEEQVAPAFDEVEKAFDVPEEPPEPDPTDSGFGPDCGGTWETCNDLGHTHADAPDLADDAGPQPEPDPLEKLLVTVDDDGNVTDADGNVLTPLDIEDDRTDEQKAEDGDEEPPLVEGEPVFDKDGNIVGWNLVDEYDDDEDEFGSDLDDEYDDEENSPLLDALLLISYNKGWNGALDALREKFSDTGAFLEIAAAIDKLRRE